jgi:hypothetical protein
MQKNTFFPKNGLLKLQILYSYKKQHSFLYGTGAEQPHITVHKQSPVIKPTVISPEKNSNPT